MPRASVLTRLLVASATLLGLGALVAVQPAAAQRHATVSAVTPRTANLEWSSPKAIKGLTLSQASCPSASFCLVSASPSVAYATYNGTKWSAFKAGVGTHTLSCVSPSFCASVGGGGDTGAGYTYDGTSWDDTPTFVTNGSSGFTSLSCTSDTFCMAGDQTGQITEYRGNGTWSNAKKIDNPNNAILSISCVSKFCLATDNNGSVMSYNGNQWSQPSTIDEVSGAPQKIVSVSCASATFCLAVDQYGQALIFDNGKWLPPSEPDNLKKLPVEFSAISCAPGSTFCVATDIIGRAVVYNNGSWSAPAAIDGSPSVTYGLASVSCATTTLCVAVDGSGRVLIGK